MSTRTGREPNGLPSSRRTRECRRPPHRVLVHAIAGGLEAIEAEIGAGREAGLDMRRADERELATPFPAMAAAALDSQLAVDPVALTDALARAFVAAGGTLHTGTRVRSVHAVPEPLVRTDAGALRADRIVLATGTAIMDRGLTFAKTRGSAVALRRVRL